MKMMILTFATAVLGMLASCDKELVTYGQGDLRVVIEAGDGWLHDFPLFLGIKTKNPPQIAVWAEDMSGNYLSTIYVTHRTASGSWRGAKERPEALPAWSHAHGAEDVDGLSGATPKNGFDVRVRPTGSPRQFVVKIEVNHSTDWNDAWPEGSSEGAANFNAESGQPALVYSAAIDLGTPQTLYAATLAGHSSPDGTDGEIRPDTSTITSALDIVKKIAINIEQR